MVISRGLFHLQISYLVPRYNPFRRIQWPMCRWPCPNFDLRSRSNLPKMGKKTKELVISRRLFHLQISYLVPRYNPIRRSQWPKCRWPWPKQGQIFPKMRQKLKYWSYLGGYFTYTLHTWYQVQPNKAHSMPQVLMTFKVKGQGQFFFQKWVNN